MFEAACWAILWMVPVHAAPVTLATASKAKATRGAPPRSTSWASDQGEAAQAWATPMLLESRSPEHPTTSHETRLINPDRERAAVIQVQCFRAAGVSATELVRYDLPPMGARLVAPLVGLQHVTDEGIVFEGWCLVQASHPVFVHGTQRDYNPRLHMVQRTHVPYFRVR